MAPNNVETLHFRATELPLEDDVAYGSPSLIDAEAASTRPIATAAILCLA